MVHLQCINMFQISIPLWDKLGGLHLNNPVIQCATISAQ